MLKLNSVDNEQSLTETSVSNYPNSGYYRPRILSPRWCGSFSLHQLKQESYVCRDLEHLKYLDSFEYGIVVYKQTLGRLPYDLRNVDWYPWYLAVFDEDYNYREYFGVVMWDRHPASPLVAPILYGGELTSLDATLVGEWIQGVTIHSHSNRVVANANGTKPRGKALKTDRRQCTIPSSGDMATAANSYNIVVTRLGIVVYKQVKPMPTKVYNRYTAEASWDTLHTYSDYVSIVTIPWAELWH